MKLNTKTSYKLNIKIYNNEIKYKDITNKIKYKDITMKLS